VAGTQNDLSFEMEAAIQAREDGRPRCERNESIDKEATVFSFQPPGCTAGVSCTGVRALVLSLSNIEPIASGTTLYTCSVAISENAGFEPYPMRCSNAAASDPAGSALATTCVDGSVTNGGCRPDRPGALLGFEFSVDPPRPTVGDHVTLTVEIRNLTNGLFGLPEYRLSGTDPFFSGDVGVRTDSLGPTDQVYMLDAVQSGTAEISMSVRYETTEGCSFFFRSSVSDPFLVDIVAPTLTVTPTATIPSATATPPRADNDDGCAITPPAGAGAAWLLLPLVVLGRRRGAAR
jgi:hypothetical protein